MYNKNTLMFMLLTIILSIALVTCSNLSSTNVPLPTASHINPTQPPTSVTVEPTNTNTPIPAIPTIPIPTLSTQEKEKITTQLVSEDYSCMLPCWGGIEPKTTTWFEAKAFLEQFANIYSSRSGIYTAEFQYKGDRVVLTFYTNKNIVEFMGAPRFEYPIYRLLHDYGKPDEIYFQILDVLPLDIDNPYTVYLVYREKGFVAEYKGASAKGTTLSICFMDSQGRKSQNTFLWLWSKETNKTFYDLTAQYMNKFSDYVSMKYYKLEELGTYKINNFFEIYRFEENKNHCIQINNPNPDPGE